jgi:hypothetical protein
VITSDVLQRQKRWLAELIAEALGSDKINYAFVHGLEDPDRIGRDLDVLVQADEIDLAVEVISQQLTKHDWRVRAHRRRNGHFWCFTSATTSGPVLEFDLFPRIRWGLSVLVNRPEAIAERNGFPFDPWAAFVKRVLIQVLAHGVDPIKRSPERLDLSEAERMHVPRHLAARLGAAAGERLWSAIVDRNLDELDTLSPQLRYALLRRSVTQPPTETLRALVDWFANKWATRLSRIPILPVVAIVGVDERRRAAVVEAMLSKAPWMLPVISVEWRRQRLLSSPRRTAPRRGSDTTESPSGRRGRGASLRAIASYVREMSADRREAAQLRLVLHDEDTSDLPMGEPRALSLAGRLSRILPKPDLTVMLVEEAASVPVRSAGVAEGRDEIRQTIRLSTASLVAVVVLPGQESDAADSIVRHIAEWMFSSASGRTPGRPRRSSSKAAG